VSAPAFPVTLHEPIASFGAVLHGAEFMIGDVRPRLTLCCPAMNVRLDA
jgi:hypothetical protein